MEGAQGRLSNGVDDEDDGEGGGGYIYSDGLLEGAVVWGQRWMDG